MPAIPFAGPSYQAESVNFDAQRSVNTYPVLSESGTSKSKAMLLGVPGYSIFSPIGTPKETRGSHEINGRVFFVFESKLFELLSDGTRTERGTLLTTSGLVGISDNGTQVCVVDGGNGYILRLSDNNFAQITAPGWRGSYTVDYLDGYFVFAEPDTDIFYISAINDGSDIDALDFATAEGAPDNIVAVKTVHQQVWLLGNNSIQIVYNSGDATFPLSDVAGVFIEYGCAARGSVAKAANTVFWLGQDAYGNGIVWMAEGYQPQRISTYAVEKAIGGYVNLDKAVGYTYQENGRYFYVLNFEGATTSWAYDIGTKSWHERAYWNTATGFYERHRGQFHVFAWGKHLIADYRNGDIYEQSSDIYDFAGAPIRVLRALPHMADDLQYIYYSRLQIDMQTGVGLSSGAVEDVDPEMTICWSDDGGYTWSNEIRASIGKAGEYRKRAIWRRLGRSRDRVFRLVITTKTKTALIAAHVDVTPGRN